MTVIQNKNKTLFNLFPTCVEQAHRITFFISWRQASSKRLRGAQQKGTKLSGGVAECTELRSTEMKCCD